ncbi:hypothetical protein HK405_001016 [Cladochytrium tenue]|nr:hypothetical protein HK405_001016 [Cladochytrium tenue]
MAGSTAEHYMKQDPKTADGKDKTRATKAWGAVSDVVRDKSAWAAAASSAAGAGGATAVGHLVENSDLSHLSAAAWPAATLIRNVAQNKPPAKIAESAAIGFVSNAAGGAVGKVLKGAVEQANGPERLASAASNAGFLLQGIVQPKYVADKNAAKARKDLEEKRKADLQDAAERGEQALVRNRKAKGNQAPTTEAGSSKAAEKYTPKEVKTPKEETKPKEASNAVTESSTSTTQQSRKGKEKETHEEPAAKKFTAADTREAVKAETDRPGTPKKSAPPSIDTSSAQDHWRWSDPRSLADVTAAHHVAAPPVCIAASPLRVAAPSVCVATPPLRVATPPVCIAASSLRVTAPPLCVAAPAFSIAATPHHLFSTPFPVVVVIFARQVPGSGGYNLAATDVEPRQGAELTVCAAKERLQLSTIEDEEPQRLKRRMGWFEAGLFNIGMIIGTGIFSNPSSILSYGGSTGISLVLWILGGIVAGSGIWAFTELGTTLPRSGGEKEYLAYAYPKPNNLLSYLFAINGLIVLRGAGIASATLVFGNYMNYAIYGPTFLSNYGSRGWAFGALTVITAINIFSVPIAIRLNSVVTVYKMLLVTLIVLVGLVAICGGLKGVDVPSLVTNVNMEGNSNSAGSFANAIYYVMNAYNGWANVNYILDEVHDPIRNLPKAAIFSIGSTTVMYVLANVAYFAVLTKEEILGSSLTTAAAFFSKAIGGTFGQRVLPGLVALSPFGLAISLLYAGSRVVLEIARQGLLPFGDYIGWVDEKYTKSPIFAILFLYVLSTIFLFAPPPGQVFNFIVSFSGYTAYFFYFLAVVGIYVVRYREPNLIRPIRVFTPAAVLFAVVSVFQLVFSFVPPTKVTTTYPYYAPYLTSVLLLIVTVGFWYLQVVVHKGPEKSFNARIAVEAAGELEKDLFGTVGAATAAVAQAEDAKEDAANKP